MLSKFFIDVFRIIYLKPNKIKNFPFIENWDFVENKEKESIGLEKPLHLNREL